MALNMRKDAPDRGHHTEYLVVVKNRDGHFVDTGVDDMVHDAAVETLKCEEKTPSGLRLKLSTRQRDVEN